MAGKCKEMSKIKQVLRLHKDGMSNRRIGRELGLYKDTVNKYVKLAKSDPLGIDKLLEMDDPVLEWHLTGGNPAYSDERFQRLQKRCPPAQPALQRAGGLAIIRYCSSGPDSAASARACSNLPSSWHCHG